MKVDESRVWCEIKTKFGLNSNTQIIKIIFFFLKNKNKENIQRNVGNWLGIFKLPSG